ncbi:Predicted membrane protein [Lentzea waywayandensis]|uniref:Predicted membrane protein n=1 Tax=Lentzea waywayandensis TaxID=84724 RepID=A0A1I6F9G3_9PSEU|nr:Predicted membrane protein [Lentzea waywayandensis]
MRTPLLSAAVLKNWGAAILVAVALTSTTAVGALAQPLPGTVSTEVRMKLERDARLSVTETVQVPDGKTVKRTVPLRLAVGNDLERQYQVTDAKIEGKGSTSTDDDSFSVTLEGGQATLTYTVVGAVAPVGDALEVRWQVAGGWDTELDKVAVSFSAPDSPTSVNCLAGPVGSSQPCTSADLADGKGVRAQEIKLGAGERVDVAIGLSAGVVPPNAVVVEQSGLAAAFALTPVSGAALGGLLVLLLGGVALLWYLRGRDAAALASEVGAVTVLVRDQGGRVAFASPDGVLPGQVGTVVDEHVDVVDVTATVIDLAVRNYLWITEVEGHDWQIVRRNPVDDSLSGYEKAVCEALLPQGVDAVSVSELRGRQIDLAVVRERLYADVVEKRWFVRRPDAERNLFWWAGIVIAVLGVVATVVLALTIGNALFGLVVAVGGVALAFGARSMPARTKRGSELLEHVRGLRGYLHGVTPEDVPEADRELVFSRSLPYAVVLGETERWLTAFGQQDLYWYGNASDFRRSFPAFLGALDGVLAQAGHLRSLRTPNP